MGQSLLNSAQQLLIPEGSVRSSTAPDFRAFTVTGISPFKVTKESECDACLFKLLLKDDAAVPRKAYIQDQETGTVEWLSL
jgi:hypothetical protein